MVWQGENTIAQKSQPDFRMVVKLSVTIGHSVVLRGHLGTWEGGTQKADAVGKISKGGCVKMQTPYVYIAPLD